MKIFNTPKQARSLREIEAQYFIDHTKSVEDAKIQPVYAAEAEKEAGEETEAEAKEENNGGGKKKAKKV